MRKLKVLPPMTCDRGCGECCGPVPCTETEFQRVRRYVEDKRVVPADQGEGTCPFYQEGQCAVYQVRPVVCRVFGYIDKLLCVRGYNVDGVQRDAERMITAEGRPTRFLHELLPGWQGFTRPLLVELERTFRV